MNFVNRGRVSFRKEFYYRRSSRERKHTVYLYNRGVPGKGCGRGACWKLIRPYWAEVRG